MKNNHIILIVLLAIFLIPSGAFACGKSHSEMKCCSKEITSKTVMKDCCKKTAHSKNKKQEGCNGKCGQTLCSTSSVNSAITASVLFEIEYDNFNFSSKKQKFPQSETVTSDGYSSIWLIPKIS